MNPGRVFEDESTEVELPKPVQGSSGKKKS
jgi:hypothetical protein